MVDIHQEIENCRTGDDGDETKKEEPDSWLDHEVGCSPRTVSMFEFVNHLTLVVEVV